MSNKNEVFEYLIDQLRQQVNKKDVTSFNVSVQISDLDEVKQVIHNLQQHIAGKDDKIRAPKDSLRQQVGNNPYKQQCEDLAHEVQSLKNQLRDMSAQIKELQSELQHQIDLAAGVYRWSTAHFDEKGKVFKVERGVKAEQSGCRKEDTQECFHNWRFVNGKAPAVCVNCGVTKSSECEHDWQFYGAGFSSMCKKCGLKK